MNKNKTQALKLNQDWINAILPEDIKIPSTTVVTGPAGAAKAIIGSMMAASWLNQGGSLIHVLTNFNRKHAERLLSYFNVKPENSLGKILYIYFDSNIKNYKRTNEDEFKANLLNPDVFNKVMDKSFKILYDSNNNVLTFMTALNMLLYSKTYMQVTLANYSARMKENSFNIFTFSDNIFAEEMNEIKEKADNLFYVHGTGIMHLGLNILKLNRNKVSKTEMITPFSEEIISRHLLEIQNHRQKMIPIIKKI